MKQHMTTLMTTFMIAATVFSSPFALGQRPGSKEPQFRSTKRERSGVVRSFRDVMDRDPEIRTLVREAKELGMTPDLTERSVYGEKIEMAAREGIVFRTGAPAADKREVELKVIDLQPAADSKDVGAIIQITEGTRSYSMMMMAWGGDFNNITEIHPQSAQRGDGATHLSRSIWSSILGFLKKNVVEKAPQFLLNSFVEGGGSFSGFMNNVTNKIQSFPMTFVKKFMPWETKPAAETAPDSDTNKNTDPPR